ncbi:MAG: cupin [Actinomycetospora sp.]|nr:cupin [Actinomycetospora sp.]
MGKTPICLCERLDSGRVDAFADLFRGVRAQGSLFGSSTLSPPWALRFVDGAPLTLCAVLGGDAWIVPAGLPPEPLRPGDTVIVRGPAPFAVVDEPGTRAEPVDCGEHCTAPEEGGARYRRGWHDPGDAGAADATTLIVGAYPVRGEIGDRLLEALPTVLRVDSGGTGDPVLEHLAAEVATDAPGQQVVLDRPAAPWTVAALAARAGVSRATLAKRFTDLVGEPPLTYLTRWRMALAADRLVEDEAATVAEIARTVGYADAFGFSAAFKRTRGVSPSRFRQLA